MLKRNKEIRWNRRQAGRGAVVALLVFAMAQSAEAAPLVDLAGRVKLLTLLQILHLAGLAIGAGGVVLIDAVLLRHLYHAPVDDRLCTIIETSSRFVEAGFWLLWLTGLCFLGYYYQFAPEKLANPKLWAKVTIVSLLTLNSVAVQEFVLPRLVSRCGQPLLAGMSLRSALPLLAVGVLSATGWMMAFLLGKLREFNDIIPGTLLLNLFGAVVALSLATAVLTHLMCAGKEQDNDDNGNAHPFSPDMLHHNGRGSTQNPK